MSKSDATFHLPMEITIDILSRLPVKSLLRFTSVCKTWYAFIKSPNFINKHLTHSALNSNTSVGPLLVASYNSETKTLGMYLHFGSGSVNLDFPFLYGRQSVSIVGICNGLVCISFSHLGYPLILCNPATRQFREIPHYKWWGKRGTKPVSLSFGFGYHPFADHYKLIRIVYYSCLNGKIVVRAELYTLSTDTWREIAVKMPLFFDGEVDDVVPCEICGDSASAVLNGVFYWAASVSPIEDVIVVSFDMGDEVLREIQTPGCFEGIWHKTSWQLMELQDKLALIIYPDNGCFDVWFLEENRTSWTKQLKVGPFPSIASRVGSGGITLVGCAKNGDFVVKVEYTRKSGDLKFLLYDPKSQGINSLPCALLVNQCEVHLYTETLLLVKTNNEVKEINEAMLKKKKKEKRKREDL